MIALTLYYGFTSSGVDNFAHIGGLAAGFLLSVLLYRKKRPGIRFRPVQMTDQDAAAVGSYGPVGNGQASPVPFGLQVKRGSKIWESCSFGMPQPVSRTVTRMQASPGAEDPFPARGPAGRKEASRQMEPAPSTASPALRRRLRKTSPQPDPVAPDDGEGRGPGGT